MYTDNILNLIKIINNKQNDNLHKNDSQSIKDYKALDEEIDLITSNKDLMQELLAELFDNFTDPQSFFDKLQELNRNIGFKESTYKLIGSIISHTYNNLPQQEGEKLISLLVHEDFNIFNILPTLPFALSTIELRYEFAYNWFNSILKKVKNDLADGYFFQALQNYVFNFYKNGIKLLKLYLASNNLSLIESILPTILGTIRARLKKDNNENLEFEQIEKGLSASPETILKTIYNISWGVTYTLNQLSINELKYHLNRMIESKILAEIDNAFHVICACLTIGINHKIGLDLNDFLIFSVNWINDHIHNCKSQTSQYLVIGCIHTLLACHRNLSEILDNNKDHTLELIIKIQPIAPDSKETWQKIGFILLNLLKIKQEKFENLMVKLIKANPKAIISNIEQMSFLTDEMNKHNFSQLLANLIFSLNNKERKIGLILFEKIKNFNLNENTIKEFNDDKLKLAILEFISRSYSGETTEKFFRCLEPVFNNADKGLKNFYINEMMRQAINYRSACFEKWKNLNNCSDIFKNVINQATYYFANLQELSTSLATAFTFPHAEEYAQQQERKSRSKLEKELDRVSIFRKIAKKTYIVYGSKYNYISGTNLSEVPMSNFSTTIELPRLELIDPEGMHLRRIRILQEIERIEQNASD